MSYWGVTLRERKRLRTRRALVEAATDLFERRGYDATTIADIAEAADLSKRAFFGHFATKEDLLFPEGEARVRAAVEAIAARRPGEGPADVLLRALASVAEDDDDLTGRRAALRMRLVRTVPAVRGRALQLQFDTQREIARRLAAAFPDELDEVTAAALTGAFVGALTAALDVLLDGLPDGPPDPKRVEAELNRAVRVALAPWLKEGGPERLDGGEQSR